MNLFNYIEKYGVYNFKEVEFNEVDNVIFSALSYLDLKGYVSSNRFNKRKLKHVANSFFTDFVADGNKMTAVKSSIKLFDKIRKVRRYENLLLYNYVYIGNDYQQFSAITIDLDRRTSYVAYEGTDHLVSGWKEDFMMSYKFPVLSQRRAIDYINRHFIFNDKNIIIGGHSKGGNLALVAGMFSNFWVKDRIVNIYINDGPGLRKEEFDSKYYNSIKNKIIHIVPNYTLIGLLLKHSDNFVVIKSKRRDLYAHDYANWVVDDTKFKRVPLSSYSKKMDIIVSSWINKYSDAQREQFVNGLFSVFDRAGVRSFHDVLKNKKLIIKILYGTKDFDKVTKNILKDFIYFIFKYFRDPNVLLDNDRV